MKNVDGITHLHPCQRLLEHISLVEVNQALIALDTFESLLLLALFNQSTRSCLKVGGGVVGGGPCDYCVSPVQRIGFLGFLDLV